MNRLSSLIFSEKKNQIKHFKISSAAVVIGAFSEKNKKNIYSKPKVTCHFLLMCNFVSIYFDVVVIN